MSRRATLLVVDDNAMNRDMLARRLERSGYGVVAVASGREALERLAADSFDVVLLDVEMPEMDGLSVLQELRRSKSRLPVIMVTARRDSSDVVEALDLGADDYVTKPVDYPVVLARIRTQLARKEAEDALRESEERYALAAKGANDGLWDWKLTTGRVYYSPRWKEIVGCDEAWDGDGPAEWFDRVHADDYERVQTELTRHLNGESPHFENEHRIRHASGVYRWVLSRGLAIRDEAGRAYRIAGSLTDITEGKVADALTGLPNRVLFMDRIGRALEQARRKSTYRFAVLFLDLDEFKLVNDSLGHQTGDQLLFEVARRLESSLRASDTVMRLSPAERASAPGGSTVARLGGDEFTILVTDMRSPSDATLIATRIQEALADPFRLGDHEVFTTASIGIAVSDTGYQRAEDVIRDADTAMYRAKSLGKARFELFDPGMRESAVSRLRLETDLRNALERREFVLYYQPIVQLDTGVVAGFEALLRWKHPERGLVPPMEFIPVAEENGLIIPIGRWVIREACRRIRAWMTRFGSSAPETICVNLSARQFLQPELARIVQESLTESGLDASALELEITESTAMTNPETVETLLAHLKALNVMLSIDDFGTGYSSLSYLHRFPLDVLKIDRTFVARMGPGDENTAIIRATLTLAHQLGLRVIAEGIETERQRDQLRELGCDYGQGFYFSPPLEADAATAWIASQVAASPTRPEHAGLAP